MIFKVPFQVSYISPNEKEIEDTGKKKQWDKFQEVLRDAKS